MFPFSNQMRLIRPRATSLPQTSCGDLGSAITISSVGFDSLGFYRSMIRAQRLLFLAAGIIIHSIKGNQDIRYGHLNEIVGAIFCVSIRSSKGRCAPFWIQSENFYVSLSTFTSLSTFYKDVCTRWNESHERKSINFSPAIANSHSSRRCFVVET